MSTTVTRKPRGFATMDPDKQRAIASKGGKAHSAEHLARIGAAGGKARGKRRS